MLKNSKTILSFINYLINHFNKHAAIYLGIFLFLPVLILSILNQPGADDFSFALSMKNRGFFQSQEFWYFNWIGRYFSTALISIFVSSNLIMLISCKLLPIILMVLFIIALWAIIKSTFNNILKTRELVLLIFSFIFIYLYNIPSMRHGVFWLTGISTYFIPSILFLFFVVVLIKLTTPKKKPLKLMSIAIALSITIIGSNEIFSLPMFFLLLFFLFYDLIYVKKINLKFLIILSIIILSSAIVILAPGNFVRESSITIGNPYPTPIEGRHNFILSFINSFKEVLSFLFVWLSNPVLIILSCFFIEFSRERVKNIHWKVLSISPIISILIMLFFLFLIPFPSYWATNYFVERLANVMYFLFLIGWFFNLLIITNYFNRKKILIHPLPRYAFVLLFILIVLNMNSPNAIRQTYVDVFKGGAFRYNNEIKARIHAIDNCQNSVCELPEIQNKPYSIFYGDLSFDDSNWVNECMSNYYGVKLVLKKQ